MSGVRMVSFLEECIQVKRNLILMDNAGAHKNKIVKEIIEKTDNKLQMTVPYRPKTNAIETWFSLFKHYFIQLQKDAMTFAQLKRIVSKAISKIDDSYYLKLMKYAYKTTEIREYRKKYSTRRRKPKNYKT